MIFQCLKHHEFLQCCVLLKKNIINQFDNYSTEMLKYQTIKNIMFYTNVIENN
jgi:hypothetical protein